MIGIFSLIADTLGARYFDLRDLDPRTLNEARAGARRSTRTATLDGGCTVYDTGLAAAERDLYLSIHASPENIAFVEYITRLYSSVGVSLPDGCYTANPKQYRVQNGLIEWRLLITGTL